MTIIPQGYKETEIGVLPNDWDIKSYGELFYFLNTATYSRAELSDDSDIDYVHYGDIHTKCNYHVDFTKMILPCITSDKLKKYPLLEIGDLIMADASEDYDGIGKSVEILNIDKKSISGLHTFLLRNKSNSLALGFKGYIHANQYVRSQFNSLATGMKVYGVSKGNLKYILIPIPPLPEQTAIANALRDIDDLINTTQALIAKKKAIKTATMQQLLTPKEDWVEMKLGERANFFSGGTPLTSIREYYNGNINFITSSELNKTKINEVSNFITSKGLQNSASKLVSEGTVLVALYGATAGVTAITNISGAINQAVLAIIPFSDNSKFIFYLLSNLKTWIINTFIQGGQGNLNANTFKELSLKFPGVDLQNGIVEILESLDLEISTLETTLFKYQSIKQGMMQNLLTGKIRLI